MNNHISYKEKQNKNTQPNTPKARLLFVIAFLALCLIGSLSAMFVIHKNSEGALVAYIYQDGKLLQEIPLSLVTESYLLKVHDKVVFQVQGSDVSNDSTQAYTDDSMPSHYDGSGQSYNLIEVRPGSIGMIDASCPDKLCVHMGFQSDAMVPITCLPNKVVIQLRINGTDTDQTLDGVSH